MSKKKIIGIALLLVLLLPLWMWLAWALSSKTKLVAAIVDKTVLTRRGQEHLSLTWILNHERFTKTRTKPYQIAEDYFGFFPLDNEKYRLKGLERFSEEQLAQLSNDADIAYYTDTYGIFNNEWRQHGDEKERSGLIYGGLSEQDMNFLRLMKAKRKLIITEFNTIGSPTNTSERHSFEKLFAMRWTGWTGRFFESLDTNRNKELPGWLIRNYKRDNNNRWPFQKSGIAFVSESDQVVILEDSTHMTMPLPHIVSTEEGANKLGLPRRVKYPFWFDVVVPDRKINKEMASFEIGLNHHGRRVLDQHHLPHRFPAVLSHDGPDYRFFYFCGDFSDNQVSITSSYFKGIGFFKWLFYNSDNPMERSSFFWNFYRPMVTNILQAEKDRLGR
ncbi:hypothetical protein [Pedobacter faecalis]|uniref:hypothetical protein n=1 Tax=Pedobacter faecalis TaxID=3041495 RepID=UPI00254CCAC5|nr:hypothetical protein [Pedobacter sp. ELA7]